jgi:hypothetical protein
VPNLTIGAPVVASLRKATKCATCWISVREVALEWRVVRGVWDVRHGGAVWGLVIQHCGTAAGVTRLG